MGFQIQYLGFGPKFGWELEFGQSQIKSSNAAWLQISTNVKRKNTTVTLMLSAVTQEGPLRVPAS